MAALSPLRFSAACRVEAPFSAVSRFETHAKLDVQTSRFFGLIWKRLHDAHRYSIEPFGSLADFKAVPEKAQKQTIRELSRKTPDSIGAKLLVASTALRAYRNRHLGTFMRCCWTR